MTAQLDYKYKTEFDIYKKFKKLEIDFMSD